jgi:hypothetical protein
MEISKESVRDIRKVMEISKESLRDKVVTSK